jgi:hypothetical protein
MEHTSIMAVDDAGHRSPDVAYEWSAGNVGGEPLMIRHFAPDAVSNLYSPGQINEPILLYRGRFTSPCLQAEGTPDRACDGDIRLSWVPTPRIEVNGEYRPGHIESFLGGGADTRIWHQRLQVRLPD